MLQFLRGDLSGFSLLEMLVVLAIMGIMLSMAYPNYRYHLIRIHRLEGQMALLDLAIRMEQYYARQDSYQNATIGQNTMTDVSPRALTSQGWYSLSITEANDNAFTLKATPRLAQIDDRLCQPLTLNHLGKKGVAVGPHGLPLGDVGNCWS